MEEIYIAVMGMTGAGKSRFIHECSGQDVRIGHSLESCTTDVDDYTFTLSSKRIHLIDTPGFDDTNKSDREVLEGIANWLGTAYEANVKLHGVLYLHRITDTRITGTGKRNLRMFKKLCGDDFYPRVFLVGTMWDKINESDGAAREAELIAKSEFWGAMVEKGTKVARHAGNEQTAMNILLDLIDRGRKVDSPEVLQVQTEMVVQGLNLDQTSAGQEFEAELIKQREKHAAEMKELQDEIKEALETSEEAAKEAEEERRVLAEKMERANIDQAMLKKSLQDMQKLQQEKIDELMGQLERQRTEYEAKIEQLRQNRLQLAQVDPNSSHGQALEDEIAQEEVEAAALEQDMNVKKDTITKRLKRNFSKAKDWAERHPNAVKGIMSGLKFVAILGRVGAS